MSNLNADQPSPGATKYRTPANAVIPNVEIDSNDDVMEEIDAFFEEHKALTEDASASAPSQSTDNASASMANHLTAAAPRSMQNPFIDTVSAWIPVHPVDPVSDSGPQLIGDGSASFPGQPTQTALASVPYQSPYQLPYHLPYQSTFAPAVEYPTMAYNTPQEVAGSYPSADNLWSVASTPSLPEQSPGNAVAFTPNPSTGNFFAGSPTVPDMTSVDSTIRHLNVDSQSSKRASSSPPEHETESELIKRLRTEYKAPQDPNNPVTPTKKAPRVTSNQTIKAKPKPKQTRKQTNKPVKYTGSAMLKPVHIDTETPNEAVENSVPNQVMSLAGQQPPPLHYAEENVPEGYFPPQRNVHQTNSPQMIYSQIGNSPWDFSSVNNQQTPNQPLHFLSRPNLPQPNFLQLDRRPLQSFQQSYHQPPHFHPQQAYPPQPQSQPQPQPQPQPQYPPPFQHQPHPQPNFSAPYMPAIIEPLPPAGPLYIGMGNGNPPMYFGQGSRGRAEPRNGQFVMSWD